MTPNNKFRDYLAILDTKNSFTDYLELQTHYGTLRETNWKRSLWLNIVYK